MMSLLDDVKMVRDEITEAYQNAYDALQEANISLGLISDLVTATPIDYDIISLIRTFLFLSNRSYPRTANCNCFFVEIKFPFVGTTFKAIINHLLLVIL